ncbi:MAG: hypothetical protein LBT01_04890 [Spirochaetaceae bacterium]|nr:hypothetical protein [Spirochaetaceae bacterium]
MFRGRVLSELKQYKNKIYPAGLVNLYTYITNNINKKSLSVCVSCATP